MWKLLWGQASEMESQEMGKAVGGGRLAHAQGKPAYVRRHLQSPYQQDIPVMKGGTKC